MDTFILVTLIMSTNKQMHTDVKTNFSNKNGMLDVFLMHTKSRRHAIINQIDRFFMKFNAMVEYLNDMQVIR